MIEVWLDTADPAEIAESDAPGITTNPKLWRDALEPHEVLDQMPNLRYNTWLAEVLRAAAGRPISLEVTSPDLAGMREQAERILALGPNVYVKIPIQTPEGKPTTDLIWDLPRVNATCCFTPEHVDAALGAGAAIVSVFAGRISDTGHDPAPCFDVGKTTSKMLWASARQVYDVVLAERAGADIITLPPDLYAKQHLLGRDLDEYALATVREFHGL